jgi:hypothetical protein
MGGKFPVDIPPNSNYIPGISDQFPLSSFAVNIVQGTNRESSELISNAPTRILRQQNEQVTITTSQISSILRL